MDFSYQSPSLIPVGNDFTPALAPTSVNDKCTYLFTFL